MGIETFPPAASSLQPMERQLLEQAVIKGAGFTFWPVQDDVTLTKLDSHAPSSAGSVPGVSICTRKVYPV